jgi:SPX domain protein involved in polyphosphate accumulation
MAQSSATEALSYDTFRVELQDEMNKIQKFTLSTVKQLRERTAQLATDSDDTLTSSPNDAKRKEELKATADVLSKDFLRLEKFVNLNYMGFHKILKKHDKVS